VTSPNHDATHTELMREEFAQEGLPQGWYTDTPYPTYGNGMWDCRKGDGVIVTLPHDAWTKLRVEVEVTDIGPNATAFSGSDSRTGLWLTLGDAPNARHRATDAGPLLAISKTPFQLAEGTNKLVFEWTAETLAASANGVELVAAGNLRQSAHAGEIHFGFRDCMVRSVAIYGVPDVEIPAPIENISGGYPLEVTVDFNDDLMSTAWTQKTFDSLFTELKSWGTQRVSWIDLGRKEDAYFDNGPLGIDEHGNQTFAHVGDIFATAVATAHKNDIELIGLFKPFDMAICGITFPPQSKAAKERGRIHRIGGSLGWSTRLAQHNQHLIMARKPSAHGPAKNEVWTRLDLVKDDDEAAEISIDDITLIVSDDNEHFRAYAGPATRTEVIEDYPVYEATPSGPRPTAQTRSSRVFRFDDLQITEAFFAIEVSGAGRSFSNRLTDLLHLFGPNGEETHFHYGLSPRRLKFYEKYHEAPGTPSLRNEKVGPEGGFEFDRYPGSPSGYMGSGGDAILLPLALDRGATSYIAVARGKDPGPMAVLSPSFPEARKLWLGWIEAMLDAGADGIDLRPGHHHSDFAWIEYGFEQPVRDEMLQRTGIDIWETDDFDRAEWRRVRGEGYTEFVREASALVRSRGKKLTLHIDGHYDSAPGLGGAMNIHWDWRTWLEEGLADRVTGKALWPGTVYAREVMALAHAKGLPVSYAPYCNNFFEIPGNSNHLGDSPNGCHVPVERLINWGKEHGYDSFLFYECASALRAAEDGSVDFRPGAAPLREVLQRHFGG